ncbi:unnamed protein product [Trifolium pratense]|uniref:Uncharacterized protein n=1 Tax=Trifolium pratense TaxID=57577 RepID=A0ACB0JS20_TRIPR|nr:unnamed protein product [Trifolium pratense]
MVEWLKFAQDAVHNGFDAVAVKAENLMLKRGENKEYLPNEGLAAFNKATAELLHEQTIHHSNQTAELPLSKDIANDVLPPTHPLFVYPYVSASFLIQKYNLGHAWISRASRWRINRVFSAFDEVDQ